MALMNEVTLKGDVIRLGQLLKLVDLVEAGSDVKALLATGAVTVNGEVEMRRGRQLVAGDQVSALGVDVRVVSDVN
jgi:ribosome-associated protein